MICKKISGVPSLSDIGKHQVSILLSDINGGTDIQSFDLNVNAYVTQDVPNEMSLLQNYPNPVPFYSSTNIKYFLINDSYFLLELFNVYGQKISTLVNDDQTLGYKTIKFNTANLYSGIYYYKLKTDNKNIIKKPVLLK